MERDTDTVLSFKNAMLDLPEIMPLQDITVSKLAAGAGRGRSTFYVYYDDIFSLYSDLIEENVAPFDQFFSSIKGREDQIKSDYNYGGIFDIICEKRRFYYILFRSNEPFFLYRLRKVISGNMRSVSDISLPNYCFIVFADRFIYILKSFLLDNDPVIGNWFMHTCVIWLECCGDRKMMKDSTVKEQYDIAVSDLEIYEKQLRMSFDDRQNVINARIKESFFKLIRNKPHWDISVVDIINDAGVSRSAFYKLYQSVDALYDKICSDVMSVLRRMFQEHNGSYYEIICKIFALTEDNKDIMIPLLSSDNSKGFNDLFVNYLIEIQEYYFGLSVKANLHDNIARIFFDVFEIFSHDEMKNYASYESVIYGRCAAAAETFKYIRELDRSSDMKKEEE